MLQVHHDRWAQAPEDLRRLSTEEEHQRTRERFLALYEITQGSCSAEVARSSGRHHQTILSWVHKYNEQGPHGLIYTRSGGRPPFTHE